MKSINFELLLFSNVFAIIILLLPSSLHKYSQAIINTHASGCTQYEQVVLNMIPSS